MKPVGQINRILRDWWREEIELLAEQTKQLAITNAAMFSRLEIHMLKENVDNTYSTTSRLRRGSQWDPIIWNSEKSEEPQDFTEDQLTVKMFAEIASGAVGCLKCT